MKIGEIKTGKSGDLLKAILGSCVGIAFLWKKKQVYGLAHCLLPEIDSVVPKLSAKYVSQAVPSLKLLMNIKPEDVGEIEVHIAGGGNMIPQVVKASGEHVGALNAAAAKKILEQFGFTIKESDVGGEQGRQMSIDCTAEEVRIHKLPKTF